MDRYTQNACYFGSTPKISRKFFWLSKNSLTERSKKSSNKFPQKITWSPSCNEPERKFHKAHSFNKPKIYDSKSQNHRFYQEASPENIL